MKRITFTLLVICAVSFLSCKKDKNDIDIKTYDQQEVQAYISANGLTGMQRDMTNGDTSGIYYQILKQGTGAVVDYPDKISFVSTVRSFDGLATSTDTIINHTDNFLGYVGPKGLQLAIKFLLKNKGGKIRVLIPSRLAYGTNGTGTGPNRIRGNQGLEYTINLIDDQAAYDDQVIQSYIKANNLTGFTKTSSGLYYKITQAGTGTLHPAANSTVAVQYTGLLLNGTRFDEYNVDGGTSTTVDSFIKGWQEGLTYATAGAKLSLIVPSRLAYGRNAQTTIPANSCLFFAINLLSVE